MIKRTLLKSFLVVLLCIVAYAFGYYRATMNTEFMLSSLRAKMSMQTLKYLAANELDKIKLIHTTDLEASIAGIKTSIKMNELRLKNLQTLYQYHALFDTVKEAKKRLADTLFKQYEILKKTNT
jgi:hypothetical protein